ncbi:hypothetical protein [Zunongwangia pacifica]|uniref:Uncharacterized protein n=1 Tax=Zunongwangia pacifica TaxID=2911062 RepID=A0A9X2CQ77_9FLAO|nr:hypothetical protein [Zunongwangia pacifica]MCL6220964.1 hypothetical protein [Zunongwangia pacifica]
MKKIITITAILFVCKFTIAQSIFDYKGFPLDEVKYYYLSAENKTLLTNETEIFSDVKQFTCDISYYEDHIKILLKIYKVNS